MIAIMMIATLDGMILKVASELCCANLKLPARADTETVAEWRMDHASGHVHAVSACQCQT